MIVSFFFTNTYVRILVAISCIVLVAVVSFFTTTWIDTATKPRRVANQLRSVAEAICTYHEINNRYPLNGSTCKVSGGFSWRYEIAIYLTAEGREQLRPQEGWKSSELDWWREHAPPELRASRPGETHVLAVRCKGGAFEPGAEWHKLPAKQVLMVYSSSQTRDWLSPCDFELDSISTHNATVGDALGEIVVAVFMDGTIARVMPDTKMDKFALLCGAETAGEESAWNAVKNNVHALQYVESSCIFRR